MFIYVYVINLNVHILESSVGAGNITFCVYTCICIHTHMLVQKYAECSYMSIQCSCEYCHISRGVCYRRAHTLPSQPCLVVRYGVATISRLLKIVGLFCKRAL